MKRTLLWVGGILGALLLVGALAVGVSVMFFGQAGVEAEEPAAAAGPALPEGPQVPLAKFVTNLAEPGTAIDVSFALVLADEKQVAQIDKQKLLLRDAILGVIRATRPAEVTGPEGKDRLAAAVMARISEILGPGVVQQVLVTDLVTQP